MRGRLDCFDGRYRYVCERGHRSQSGQPFMDICTAITPWYGPDHKKNGPPCGGEIEGRFVDYRGEGETDE